MNMLKVLSCLALGLLMSCAANPDFNPSKAHHTRSGFKNIGYADSKGFWEFSKWRWQRLFKDIPAAEDYHFELVKPPDDLLQNNTDRATLTWIGHATFLIQFSGLNILTDEPLDEPPVKLAVALEKHRIDATKFTVFKHGETRMLDDLFAGPGAEKLSDMLADSGQDQ